MPLTSAIQSAMAIRHEREKRHQRRLSKIRRESGVSSSFVPSYFQKVSNVLEFDWDLQVESLGGSGGGSHRPSVSSLGAASTRTEVSLKPFSHIFFFSSTYPVRRSVDPQDLIGADFASSFSWHNLFLDPSTQSPKRHWENFWKLPKIVQNDNKAQNCQKCKKWLR